MRSTRSSIPSPRIHDYADAGNIHKLIISSSASRGWVRQADVVLRTCSSSREHPPANGAARAVADWSPPPDGKLTLWSATQTPHYVHRALAKVLELRRAHRVIACPNGGGSAGKAIPSVTRSCGQARDGHRPPVNITLTAKKSSTAPRAHPTLMW